MNDWVAVDIDDGGQNKKMPRGPYFVSSCATRKSNGWLPSQPVVIIGRRFHDRPAIQGLPKEST
jgi:hypothetical protein